MIKKKIIFYAFLLAVSFAAVSGKMCAQQLENEPLDKVIAVVGNEIVTQSDLNSQILLLAQQNPELKPNDPDMRQKVLDAIINEKLIIAKAIEDSVEATDEEIRAGWENFLKDEVKKYGSEKRVEDVYGMSLAKLQYETRDIIRKRILSDKIKQQKFGDIKVSPREVEEFYNTYKDSLPVMPDQIELYHLVKNVEASKNNKQEVYNLALKVRDSLLKGGDFADFAKRYSGDPGTAASGGDLGWFEKGKLFPEFEKAAFALQKNEISMPVETPYGYHLIQTLEKSKDSVLTRHILFKIGQSEEDVKKVEAFLNSIKDSIKAGKTFEEMAKKYSDEKETQGFGGYLGKIPVTQIPAQLQDVIRKMPDGSISDAMPYMSDPKPTYHIIYKKQTIPQHKASVKDDYRILEQFAISAKQNKLLLDWVQSLRKSIYWEVKS